MNPFSNDWSNEKSTRFMQQMMIIAKVIQFNGKETLWKCIKREIQKVAGMAENLQKKRYYMRRYKRPDNAQLE